MQEMTKKIMIIWKRMKAAQSRQKSYADKRRRPLKIRHRRHGISKGVSVKGVVQIDRSNKLNPRYAGPFEILERIGPLAYRLALPPGMERIHNVFHVSQLRKYVPDPSHILSYLPVQIHEDLSYTEEPVQILDHKVKQLKNKTIPLVKILWRS